MDPNPLHINWSSNGLYDFVRTGTRKFAPDPYDLWQEGEFKLERDYTIDQLPFISSSEEDQAKHRARRETRLPHPIITRSLE